MTHASRFLQAGHIVKKCGGSLQVARMLGKNRTTVWRWFQPRTRGGSDGLVPTNALTKLLGVAREQGVYLSEQDLLPRVNPDYRGVDK